MNPLSELADQHGSDKGVRVGNPPHRYTFLYDLIFHELRARPIALAEIGLAIGGPELGGPVDRKVASPSVAMWQAYFPEAHIYGFDISDFSHLATPRFTFVREGIVWRADVKEITAFASPACNR